MGAWREVREGVPEVAGSRRGQGGVRAGRLGEGRGVWVSAGGGSGRQRCG